jgi:pimeloyl-ACP methyl ester carboxylesterase
MTKVVPQAGLATERIRLHGRELAYRDLAGGGIPVVLVHGIGSSTQTWLDIPERIAASGRRVVAVDLPGHGESSREPGDYSLGAMASTIRDLLDRLGVARVHLVGHSLGGGVCLQFQYQFPERVDAMVLESSGGLGVEAFTGLRAAALPGSELAIRAFVNRRTIAGAGWVGRQLGRLGCTPHALSTHALATAGRLAEPDRRGAFLSTLRSVVSPSGQRVSALDKLHLVDGSRVLIVWGDQDPMIPIAHGQHAHGVLEGSRLVVFTGAGHEPHLQDPQLFAELVIGHLAPLGTAAGT